METSCFLSDDYALRREGEEGKRQRLSDDRSTDVYSELAKDYQMVTAPGPGMMRVQAALADAQASNSALDTASSVLPAGVIVFGAKVA